MYQMGVLTWKLNRQYNLIHPFNSRFKSSFATDFLHIVNSHNIFPEIRDNLLQSHTNKIWIDSAPVIHNLFQSKQNLWSKTVFLRSILCEILAKTDNLETCCKIEKMCQETWKISKT